MPRSFQIFLLLAAAPILTTLPAAAEIQPLTASSTSEANSPRPNGLVFIGGTGGGMTGGGMGGGMIGAGIGGTSGGMTGYSVSPAVGLGQTYGGDVTSSGGSQPAQNYQCITQQGHCSVASTPGALRHGASCTCLFGGPGKIK